MNGIKYTFKRITPSMLDEVMPIYEDGRRAIATLGIDQWQGGYPSRDVILQDIENERLFAAVADDGRIAAVAAVIAYEPDYEVIDGEWISDGEYNAVHRVAASAEFKGRGASAYLFDRIEEMAKENGIVSLRIDTHRGNTVMQKFVAKRGFAPCGLITLGHGEGDRLRLAYEKVIL